MVWVSFASGVTVGIVLGIFVAELLQLAVDLRERKRLPLDRHLL